MKGFFGDLFDFNHDGKLDATEQAIDFAAFACMMDETKKQEQEDELTTDLELSGLDPSELEFMDEDERRKALEDAGLDLDDYDFS